MPHADWLITVRKKVILPAQEIHLAAQEISILPARDNIVQIKCLRKTKAYYAVL